MMRGSRGVVIGDVHRVREKGRGGVGSLMKLELLIAIGENENKGGGVMCQN